MPEALRVAEPEIQLNTERRASRRVRVTCPATLETMTTYTHGTLGDISETGARFEAAEPPGKGATALLKWGQHEAVCTIIWHDDGACGVWFKQPLPADVVEETAALDRVVEMPIASVGNITQGRKRSMGFLKRATVEGEPSPAPAFAEAPCASAAAPAPEPVPVPLAEPVAEDPPIRIAEPEPVQVPVPESDPVECATPPEPAAAEAPAFGRAGGLPPPSIGHSETLAEILRRYRQTGSWQD